MTDRIAYSREEAAQVVGVSLDTIRRAIRAKDKQGNDNPNPLPAKRVGRKIRISHDDLLEWFASLPDA